MIRKEILPIVSNKKIAHESYELVLKSEYISSNAIPGQFLHVLIKNHTLRRPLSIAAIDKTNHTVTLLYKVVGSGTADLIAYNKNENLQGLGPGGDGLVVAAEQKNEKELLVVGEMDVPQLHILAQKLCQIKLETR